MRFTILSLMALTASFVAGSGVVRAECTSKADIEAAYTKQMTGKGWRHVITSTDADGQPQEEVYEFINPDRMYRKVVTRGEAIETIGIGKWAWTNIGGGYSELQPQFAQMVASRREQAFVKPAVTVEFSCLGKVSYEGKEVFGYQTKADAQPDGTMLARTIYVDAATGLPVFNVVSAPDKTDKPVRKEVYSYPEKIEIEKPI